MESQVKNRKLTIMRLGNGEPLVLIHGLGSAATAWKVIAPNLSQKFELFAIDLPGHGHSPYISGTKMEPTALAEYVHEELANLGISQFHLVGNSLGGWVALELAAKFPDSVLSVTAVAPAGLWLVPETKRASRFTLSRTFATTTHSLAPIMMRYRWLKKIGFESVSPQWESLPAKVCADATIAYGTSAGFWPAWDGMLGVRFDKPIDSKIPVTIIFGDSDNTLPAQYSQERTLAPKHSRWVVLPESGHAPMWDRAPEVIAEIIKTAASK